MNTDDEKVISFRIKKGEWEELESERIDIGLKNLTDYMRLIVERRHHDEVNIEQAAKNRELRQTNARLEARNAEMADSLFQFEQILGPSFRKTIGQEVRVKNSDKVITINTMTDLAQTLVELTKISDDEDN